MTKRIVIEHTAGRLKGMMQILGTDDQLKKGMEVAELPTFLTPLDFGDHQGAASLITVTPRYAFYRETWGPLDLKSFNPEQQ